MITRLTLHNFKSWREADIEFGSITAFFGANSSGKTSLLQFLLLLKQTVEHPDPTVPLFWGNERSLVDLGGYLDTVYGHNKERALEWTLQWKPEELQKLPVGEVNQLSHHAVINYLDEQARVRVMRYEFGKAYVGLRYTEDGYEVETQRIQLNRSQGRPARIVSPLKCYGFPEQAIARYRHADFMATLNLAFTQLFERVYYLGPLREHPKRLYHWSGVKPRDVGSRGEQVIDALIAARQKKQIAVSRRGRGGSLTVEQAVAEQLRAMGLIHSFRLHEVAKGTRSLEARVMRTENSPAVALTDIGFGVSQVLPVVTLCYYAPVGSILILEQPEIHLHPAAQMGLADVIIDAVKTRNLQVILETHSEHFLLRLQRRVAEQKLTPQEAKLYFCEFINDESQLTTLRMNEEGEILNYPPDFFADPLAEAIERRKAALKHK
ncbi:MAG: AAA family ATPase [Fimbriimonadales bacterium]|nr:AAA family ATPase [Fimbriimonadales bacterium]